MSPEGLDSVKRYAGRAGVFPVHPSGDLAKVPAGAAMFPDLSGEARSEATGKLVCELRGRGTTLEEIERWWGGRRAWGVALNGGDYQCIDFDDPSIIAAWVALLKENGLEGLLDSTARAKTPNGFHVWAYVPGCDEGSHKLARHAAPVWDERRGKEVLARIESRGVGGYALVHPSPGYSWINGTTVLDLPAMSLEDFDSLVVAAMRLDEGPPEPDPEPIEPRPRRADGEESPNDWYERTASWDDLLCGKAGGRFWRQVGHRRQYTRPGKPCGPSIVTGNGQGQNRAKVHTPNWPPFEQGESISLYYAYAILYHDRDKEAATRAIAAMPGYPKRPRKPKAVTGGDPRGRADVPPAASLAAADDKAFMRTDLGNARRLVRLHGQELRYCSDWGRWLAWGGVTWDEDSPDDGGARAIAHRMTDALCESAEEKDRVWGSKSQSSGAISAMLRETQVMLGVRSKDLDLHDHLLAFENGVVDLRTGVLIDNPRDLLITKRCGTHWDPGAKCPIFDDFLVKVTKERKDLVVALLRALGYTLTGTTAAHKFFLMYGPRARNGKSTLTELMDDLLGASLCGAINKKLLVDSGRDSARFAVAALEGKRMVHANESSKGRTFDTEFLKEFSGGTKMQAERKGKDEYTIRINAKLWLSVNNLPVADWTDAYASRVFAIPFEQSFYNPDHPKYQDGDLPDLGESFKSSLRSEAPGIMARLVRLGAVPYYSEGLFMPQEVKALLERYQTENDHIGQWIEERCVRGPHDSHRIRMSEAFLDFRGFVKEEDLRVSPRINEFSVSLQNRPGLGHVSPKNKSTITGIALRSAFEGEWERA